MDFTDIEHKEKILTTGIIILLTLPYLQNNNNNKIK
jgi:hypothetical protein